MTTLEKNNQTKNIAVVGMSGAGKTIYMSQVFKYLENELSKYHIMVTPSYEAVDFVKKNPVEMDVELPMGSISVTSTDTYSFELAYRKNGNTFTTTLSFSYVDAEVLFAPAGMEDVIANVKNSDGIILVVGPEAFSPDTKGFLPSFMDAIGGVLGDKSNLPIAFCLSKGDLIDMALLGEPLKDISNPDETLVKDMLPFGAEEYNKIQAKLSSFISKYPEITASLRTNFIDFNYFLFSSIGTEIKLKDDFIPVPAGPVLPKRIMEPILWLLNKFSILESDGLINEPKC